MDIDLKWDRKGTWYAITTEEKAQQFKEWASTLENSKEGGVGLAAPAQAEAAATADDESQKVFLQIPYERKDSVKAECKKAEIPLRFDGEVKAWYTYKDTLTPSLKEYIPEREVETNEKGVETFADALRKAGAAEIPAEPQLDGKFHRLSEVGDAKGTKSISYKGYNNGVPNAVIQNHRTGDKTKWIGTSTKLSQEDYRQLKIVNANRAEEARVKRANERVAGEEKCKRELAESKPAQADHPYLKAKGIEPGVLRQNDRAELLVPLSDATGQIKSLQRIRPDGTKSYARGADKNGHFHAMGDLSAGKCIYIAEGVATAATLRETSGQSVVACMDSSNLKPVAEALRKQYPDKHLVIAADNDRHLVENPRIRINVGLEKALEAAQASRAQVVYPEFQEGEKGSDFNDLGKIDKERVSGALKGAMARWKGTAAREGAKAATSAQEAPERPKSKAEAGVER